MAGGIVTSKSTVTTSIAIDTQETFDLAIVRDKLSLSDSIGFSYGTGNNQYNFHYQQQLGWTGDSSLTIDLSALTNTLGSGVGLQSLKLFYISWVSASISGVDKDLEMTPGVFPLTLPWGTDIIRQSIPIGGSFIAPNPLGGYLITALNRNITVQFVDPGTGDAQFEVVVLGVKEPTI
jgi:hypothetical protein